MDTILKLIGDMTLSDLGSMASIISLIFTILVLIDVRRLKKSLKSYQKISNGSDDHDPP